jgi:hypothetical protein
VNPAPDYKFWRPKPGQTAKMTLLAPQGASPASFRHFVSPEAQEHHGDDTEAL